MFSRWGSLDGRTQSRRKSKNTDNGDRPAHSFSVISVERTDEDRVEAEREKQDARRATEEREPIDFFEGRWPEPKPALAPEDLPREPEPPSIWGDWPQPPSAAHWITGESDPPSAGDWIRGD